MSFTKRYPGGFVDRDITKAFDAQAANAIEDAIIAVEAAGVDWLDAKIYDPRDYGALFNGVQDDGPAINSAINAARDAGGGIVMLPQTHNTVVGTSIKVNTTIVVKGGVWLKGASHGTDLSGSATPMISVGGGGNHDRMMVSDISMANMSGTNPIGVETNVSGALQLGWPRITIERVTVVGAYNGFKATAGIETRFINCVAKDCTNHCFWDTQTDNFYIGCTAQNAGQSTTANMAGFMLQGANHKLTACKAFGCGGSGFALAGAGRHMLSACEAQDNGQAANAYNYNSTAAGGFSLISDHNVLGGCLADTNRAFGFHIVGSRNSLGGCCALFGGGGSGMETVVGFMFDSPFTINSAIHNTVVGTSNCPAPVGGRLERNSITINGVGLGLAHKKHAFATPLSISAYDGEVNEILLTGNITINLPPGKLQGQRLTFVFRQDASGGRTVTFNGRVSAPWTPDTAANKVNIITLQFVAGVWRQIADQTGLVSGDLTFADNFNRADGALVGSTSSSGHVWTGMGTGAGSWGIATNQAAFTGGNFVLEGAVLDAGVTDVVLEATYISGTVDNFNFVMRYVDDNNFNSIGSVFTRRFGGADRAYCSSQQLALTAGDVMRVEIWGSQFALYRNSTKLFTVSEPHNAIGTKFGIAAGNPVTIDDFKIL